MWGTGTEQLRKVLPLAAAVALALGVVGAAVPGASGAAIDPASGGHAAALGGTAAPGSARVKPVVACGQLATIAHDFSNVPGAPTFISSATQSTQGGVGFCSVSGYIAPQEGFLLSLPVTTWTGQYLQQGCGGFCGVPVGIGGPSAAAAGCPAAAGHLLAGGAEPATAFDNTGHIGGVQDALWASEDPALRLSFGYTSEHALAQAAKAIITAYYGKPPTFSYYEGCSDGGREALVEAQRYPRDFNGVLAGAPGNIEAELLGVVPAWVITVNTGAHGHQILGSEKLPALHAAVIKACGDAHGLIPDPRSCGFNPATIGCPAGVDNNSCLTPAQVQVVRDIYLGPSDGHGHWLYPGGQPYGSELAWTPEFIDPSSDLHWPVDTPGYQIGDSYLKYAAYWHNPPASFQLTDFRFTPAAYRKLLPLAGLYDATDPNLAAFARDGGKLILYQGWADQEISPFGTIGYYKAAVQRAGGFAASQRFTRLYLIPGQYHCLSSGSPPVTANLLSPLIAWVEHGTAPGTISFPLVHPTPALRAITVHPFNPLLPPPGGARGLNTRAHWIGRFQSGTELWCQTVGKDLVCRHHPPHS
jgi:tannase/feruloyl esterase